MSDGSHSPESNATGHVPAYAPALVYLGLWGLLLAVLNMFSMATPAQHVSWGGLLTFETTNAAFGQAKDGFHFEPLGDTIFMLGCVGLIVLGTRVIGSQQSVGEWFKGLIFNDTWPALNNPDLGGGQRTLAAWCLFLGLAFYFWFGLQYQGWMDVGVYSVTIALMATGFALNHSSRAPPGDDKVD